MRVKVKGLREFSRAVAAADKGLKKEIRLALNEAADLVVSESKPVFPVLTGRAANTIRAASTQKASRVRLGGAKAPYGPWLEFGGKVGKSNSIQRRYVREGRYVYEKYRRLRDSGEFQQAMTGALVELGDKAGLEVKPQ